MLGRIATARPSALRLAACRSVLELYALEYVMSKFPDMPIESVKTIVQAYTAPQVLSSVGQSFGVQLLMRWKSKGDQVTEGVHAAQAWVMLSLIGAVYQHKGPAAAKKLIHTYFLSRAVNVEAHLDMFIKMNQPRALLTVLAKRLNKPKPVARLIKETGRLSSNAVFIVGMYSGIDKIGEGYGSSLKMAETRAVKDALLKVYQKEIKNIQLPSDLAHLSEETISFFEDTPAKQ
eukprot:jgi/Hompol1/538/HPOL_001624-RA